MLGNKQDQGGDSIPHNMMTSSNGNIFRVTGHLCAEITGHRWIPRTKASDADSFVLFFDLRLYKLLSKQSWGWWFETPSRPLGRHCNETTCKTSKACDRSLDIDNCVESWQASRQRCCPIACRNSKWYQHFNTQSRGFEALRHITVGRLVQYWISPLLQPCPSRQL